MADQQQPVSEISVSRQRLRPGRFITLGIVFLILGAIVNVAVAWGIAARPFPRSSVLLDGSYYESNRTIDVEVAPGEVHLCEASPFRSLMPKEIDLDEFQSLLPPDSTFDPPLVMRLFNWPDQYGLQPFYSEHAFGWPALALYCRLDQSKVNRSKTLGEDVTSPEPVPSETHVGAFIIPSERAPEGMRRTLPLLPIGRGFVINTIFYALLLGLSFSFLVYGKRWFRRRRGQCPTCGYPMGESPCCTECGDPLPRQAETK